jgi:hypothetical protein
MSQATKKGSLYGLLEPVLKQLPSIRPDFEIDVLHEVPVETLYLALKEADAELSLWVLNNATPDQIQRLIDIDCWQGSEFLPARMKPYFTGFALCEHEALGRLMAGVDSETIVRCLIDLCTVIDFDPQNPPEFDESKILLTPDSKYALILKTDDPNMREALMLWCNKLSAVNIELLRRHLESTKWELESDLEEHMYKVKKGRLDEMGFVDHHEALALYAAGNAADFKARLLKKSLDPNLKFQSIKSADYESDFLIQTEFLPDAISTPLWGKGFLRSCLKQIGTDPLKLSILEMEIVRTVNASLSADKLLFQDNTAIFEASTRARRYIELGLMYIAEADAQEGGEMLKRHRVFDLYRLGWLAVSDLNKVASELCKPQGAQFFGEPDSSTLRSIILERHADLSPEMTQSLSLKQPSLVSIEGILKMGERLKVLAQLKAFVFKELGESLEIKTRPLGEAESLFSRLLTGLLRQAWGDANFSVRPISQTEWESRIEQFSRDKFYSVLELVLERAPDPIRPFFESRLREQASDVELAAQEGKKAFPDSRFVTAINLESRSH